MKNNVSVLALSLLSLMSFNSLATGDQAVNCGVKVVGTKSMYGGTAQCDDHYTVRTCKPASFVHEEVPSDIGYVKVNGFSSAGRDKALEFIKQIREQIGSYNK